MAQRADDMDGSLREILTGRHAGKWRVQYIQADDLGRKRRLSRLFDTKKEGRDFLQSLRHGARVEIARQRELTLGGWFDWLAEHDWPESLDPKTIALRRGLFNRYVRAGLGGQPLAKINPLVVRGFYRELIERGVGLPTVRVTKACLVRTFNQAVTPYGRVPVTAANPFQLVIKSSPPRKAVAITPEMAKEALACPELDAAERAMLGIYLLAGVRLSEQMAMTRGQLLLDRGLIVVDRAVKLNERGGQSVGLPKGGKKRISVMSPTLRTILCPVAEGLGAHDYLWSCLSENKPRMKKRTYDAWKEIVRKTGLPADMSPHDCRLSHINWIEKLLPEVSPTTLKEHVGHASGRTVTEINYTRPLTPAQDILRNGLERLVSFESSARDVERPHETPVDA